MLFISSYSHKKGPSASNDDVEQHAKPFSGETTISAAFISNWLVELFHAV